MDSDGHDDTESGVDSDSTQVLNALDSDIQRDHGDRPLEPGDHARIWRHASLHGVELFQGSYQNYQFARHFHRVPAIGVVDRGSMSSYCRRGNHILGTGTVLLLNPGEIHAPAPAGSKGWSFRMFYLDEEFFRSTLLDRTMPEFRFRQPFVQNRELASDLFRLHVELEEDGDRLRFESLLVSIFSCIAERHLEIVSPAAESESNKTAIAMARQYLEANYSRNFSLAELADLSPFGASHFLRVFRDTIGLTPHAYLTQFRIELAMSLLRTGMPLVDVANMVGFTDQSHFTKKFKRILGVTPGQYALAPRGTRRRPHPRTRPKR